MTDEFTLLDRPKLVPPAAVTLKQLEGIHPYKRSLCLAYLTHVPGHCVWCTTPLTGRRVRWCSEDCLQSAMLRCYPQRPCSKMMRLIYFQDSACLRCGQCYEQTIRDIIMKKWQWNTRWERTQNKLEGGDIPLVTLFQVGFNTGHIWQVDHITPIWAGGHGTDPDNLQVLCVHCHKAKTAAEAGMRSAT